MCRQVTSRKTENPFSQTTKALPEGSTPPSAGAEIERGAHPHRLGSIRQPEAQVENGVTQIEHGAATGFVAPGSPAQLGPAGTEDVPAAPDALNLAQFSALHEAADDLDVGAIAMVQGHHEYPLLLLGGAEYLLHFGRGQREGTLDEHVQIGRQRREDVGFVQVIGSADGDRVELLVLQQLFDVAEGIRHLEAIGQRPGLGHVGVADGHYLDALELPQHGQVGDLGDRSGADDADSDGISHS